MASEVVHFQFVEDLCLAAPIEVVSYQLVYVCIRIVLVLEASQARAVMRGVDGGKLFLASSKLAQFHHSLRLYVDCYGL